MVQFDFVGKSYFELNDEKLNRHVDLFHTSTSKTLSMTSIEEIKTDGVILPTNDNLREILNYNAVIIAQNTELSFYDIENTYRVIIKKDANENHVKALFQEFFDEFTSIQGMVLDLEIDRLLAELHEVISSSDSEAMEPIKKQLEKKAQTKKKFLMKHKELNRKWK